MSQMSTRLLHQLEQQKMRSSTSLTPLSQLPIQLYYQMAVTSLMLLHPKLTRMFATNHTLLWMTTIIDLNQTELTTMTTADNTSCCTSPSETFLNSCLISPYGLRHTNTAWQVIICRHLLKKMSIGLSSSSNSINLMNMHNLHKLRAQHQPIAVIKALHSGPSADKPSSDDASRLESHICIAHGARVMLTTNVWATFGLVNGAMSTISHLLPQWRSSSSPFGIMGQELEEFHQNSKA